MPPTERSNDALILSAIGTVNDRLSQYDSKFDLFTISFNTIVAALDKKITDKVETIICTTKDVEKLTGELNAVKVMLDPENRKARYFAFITGVLALMNVLQLSWGYIQKILGVVSHP